MATVKRIIDRRNLIRELSDNKVDALELIREALANAKDHGATRVWIETRKGGPRDEGPVVILADDGDGMTDEGLQAFWGVSASVKPPGASIGYKGHGTKLYYASQRLSVATCVEGGSWRVVELDRPYDSASEDIEVHPLTGGHPLRAVVDALKLSRGTIIQIDGCRFHDASRLLKREVIESYCDWFTVIGDVRSGLFDRRCEFHEVVQQREAHSAWAGLKTSEVPLRPIAVFLKTNGDESAPLGGAKKQDSQRFFQAWEDDRKACAANPGLLMFGHRFADQHESKKGTTRVRDDLTALRLSSPDDWEDDGGYAVVARVEGQRRQRETYLEARWQGKNKGEYNFEERFGLWLCRDFVPVVRRNDLLQKALEKAAQKNSLKQRVRFELSRLRNWQIFVNHQDFILTANRNELSNQTSHTDRIVDVLATRLERSLRDTAFQDWIRNVQRAVADVEHDREVARMERRQEAMIDWGKKPTKALDAFSVGLDRLDEEESFRLPLPSSEQELFYVYALLSARFNVPVRILEYDAHEGVDAIAKVRDGAFLDVQPTGGVARLELKYTIEPDVALDHFFDAIDAVLCWDVKATGKIDDCGDAPLTGDLVRRKKPLLSSKMDTHEIIYETAKKVRRVIPILCVKPLFAAKAT